MALDSRSLVHHATVLDTVMRDAYMQMQDGSDGENSMIQMPFSYVRDAVGASGVIGCRYGLKFYGPVFVLGCMCGGLFTIAFSWLS